MALETLCPSPMVSMEMARAGVKQVGMSTVPLSPCLFPCSEHFRHWPTSGMLGGWAGRRGERQAGVRGDGERGRRVSGEGAGK